jgi:magnesium-protoporphyrin O-methyltransferase
VADCCDPEDYRSVFSERFARRTAKRYRKRGLTPAAEGIVQFATDNDLHGASVLEIGAVWGTSTWSSCVVEHPG